MFSGPYNPNDAYLNKKGFTIENTVTPLYKLAASFTKLKYMKEPYMYIMYSEKSRS